MYDDGRDFMNNFVLLEWNFDKKMKQRNEPHILRNHVVKMGEKEVSLHTDTFFQAIILTKPEKKE